MLNLKREWVTPLVMGAFLVSAVTGVLLFFHLDSGLNKTAHEWLSWAVVAGVALHVANNFGGFRRHLGNARGQAVIGVFALFLALSFIPAGASGKPPFLAAVTALAEAPVPTLAQVAGVSPEQMKARMAAAGLRPGSDQQSLGDLVGDDPRRQAEVLARLLQAEGTAN